jgi:plastocyanin
MLFDVLAMTPDDFDAWLDGLIEKENATPPPAPSGAASLEVTAEGIAFDKTDLEVAADAPFVIDFRNNDPSALTHDIDIRESDGTTVVQDQPTIPGGQEKQYAYEPLAAGSYKFICSIHPASMSGTLTVQ